MFLLRDNPEVKRRLAQSVVQTVGSTCPVCKKSPVSVQDVQIVPGTSGNSPGKVTIACSSCRKYGKAPLASDEAAKRVQKPLGTLFFVQSPLVVSERTEEDRLKARAGEKERWGDWTHLERRIHERVAPHATRGGVQEFIRSVAHVLRSRLPGQVRIDERDSLLIRIGDLGGIHLAPTPEGGLVWGTWFPPDKSWYSRACSDTWAADVAREVEVLARDAFGRSVKSNPLVEFLRPEGVSWREVQRHQVPLFAPNAQERYRVALERLPFNLVIVLRETKPLYGDETESKEDMEYIDRLMEEGQRKGTLFVVEDILRRREDDADFEFPKWTPARMSPMTPFTILHRLFDEMMELGVARDSARLLQMLGGKETFALAERVGYGDTKSVVRRLVNSGVDTAAGRNEGLTDSDQVLADLFAKWCITGRIAFDPTKLPPFVDPSWRESKEFVDIRRKAVTEMESLFSSIVARCKRGGVVLI